VSARGPRGEASQAGYLAGWDECWRQAQELAADASIGDYVATWDEADLAEGTVQEIRALLRDRGQSLISDDHGWRIVAAEQE
jgi:hypothetical protein